MARPDRRTREVAASTSSLLAASAAPGDDNKQTPRNTRVWRRARRTIGTRRRISAWAPRWLTAMSLVMRRRNAGDDQVQRTFAAFVVANRVAVGRRGRRVQRRVQQSRESR